MSSTHEIHRRALSAAIAVIGRHRHRAGVAAMGAVLSGSLACVPDPDDIGGSEGASEATTMGSTMGSTTIDDTALSDATGMTDTEADTEAMTTGTGGQGSAGSEGTGESSAGSTGEGTTTGDTTTDTTTGDTTTDTSTSSSTEGETGLSDCKNGDGETDWECCAEQNWEPAEHCTPWGPPAPPRFTGRAPLPRLV